MSASTRSNHTQMSLPALECIRLSPAWEEPLAEFFRSFQEDEASHYFHPHPFTSEEAKRLANYKGQDLYYVLASDGQVLGYGMLRGWDEGYSVPSLGIALLLSCRGLGLGRVMMTFLHAAARLRGVEMIRLKVYPENEQAIGLYEKLGYEFTSKEADQLVGYLNLRP